MTIVEKIKSSITAATSLPVYYHDEPTLNLMADNVTLPCAFVYILEQGDVVQQSGTIKESVNAFVFFADKTEFDFDAEANEAIIDACKAKAFAWLASTSQDANISIKAVNRTSRLYDKFDVILTGFAVDVDIEELQGQCY